MLKVICIVEKEGTAIDRLAKCVIPFMFGIDYKVIEVHPKRPDPEQLQKFEKEAGTADIIDYQYFRTAEMLRERYPQVKAIPSILTHNNPYSIHEKTWNDYQCVVANNRSMLADLEKITTARLEIIPLAVDPYFWKYNDDWQPNRRLIMVANRIEAKKGILEVAQACLKLNIKMDLVGNISDMNYFTSVMSTGVVEFAQNISDEKLRELYYKAGLHVCNSQDGFESGTLPILESIFCGTPVLTRLVGHVPEFSEAVIVNESAPDDIEKLTESIDKALSDRKRLETLRSSAWFEIKDRIPERRAYAYKRLYRELLDGLPVTVILPVAGKPDLTLKNLEAIESQTHKNIEVIVVDDGIEEQSVAEFAKLSHLAIKYIKLGGEGYHLAKARNKGVIEATSDVLVFCDQRMIMEPEAVATFLEKIKPKTWLFGDKGANKKEFVENFSCIYRDDLATLGMFNEEITEWGGMSQEIRARARRQGVALEYVPEAKSSAAGKSSNKHNKKYEVLRMKTLLWKLGLL